MSAFISPKVDRGAKEFMTALTAASGPPNWCVSPAAERHSNPRSTITTPGLRMTSMRTSSRTTGVGFAIVGDAIDCLPRVLSAGVGDLDSGRFFDGERAILALGLELGLDAVPVGMAANPTELVAAAAAAAAVTTVLLASSAGR